MSLPLQIHPDSEAAARRVVALVAERVRRWQEEPCGSEPQGRSFSLALSRARPELLAALAESGLLWGRVAVFQVDERVAPEGAPERNLTGLLSALPPSSLRPMPVDDDLEEGARRYEAGLPERLDLVHLGLGTDGHTASLLPSDPVLGVRDRRVAVTGEHGGHRRMTLTYPALEAARELVWLVTGEDKREALRRLVERDESIPASRIANPAQLVVADSAAASTIAL